MTRLPSLFISHGSPVWALIPGVAGALLQAVARDLPRPRAALIVSPHWMTSELRVSGAARPQTIHDFGGFPRVLYEILYEAPGHPQIAETTVALLKRAGWSVTLDPDRGLDHGAWVPMLHLYPEADLPVFQVSMPAALDPEGAWRLGESLKPLASEGVLIIGSGSLTHNLGDIQREAAKPQRYAKEFSAWVRKAVLDQDADRLKATLDQAPHAQRAHPTTEHFLPLLVAAGAADPEVDVRVIDGGIDFGVLSMESYVFGAQTPPTPAAADSGGQ